MEQPGSLSQAMIDFIKGDISLMLASQDMEGVPALGRGLACQATPDRRQIRVFLSVAANPRLVEGIAASGLAALVVNRPSTHESIQFKGRDARVTPADESDWPVVDRCIAGFARDVELVGLDLEFSRAFTAHDRASLVVVTFTPLSAFDQAPGPKAGDEVAL